MLPTGASTLPPPPSGGANPPPTWPHAPFDRAEPTPTSTLGLQNLLLILGTSLVAVAALVFMAVNWSRLGARFQGGILLGITAFVGVVAASCSRRRLPATAEALGVVAVLLALVDVHALRVGLHPAVSGEAWWAASGDRGCGHLGALERAGPGGGQHHARRPGASVEPCVGSRPG
jgi:hypothetical protein